MATAVPTELDTRRRILDAARLLANTDGVEAVTVRAVAAALDLSPGNVSYHFARRADLLVGLAAELSARNHPLGELVPGTVDDLLERYRATMFHQHEHRGIVVALPHLMDSVPEVRDMYQTVERSRFVQQRRQLAALVEAGELTGAVGDLERILATLVLIGRSWLAEHRTSFRSVPLERAIGHYLALMAHALSPAATPPAAQRLRAWTDGLMGLLG